VTASHAPAITILQAKHAASVQDEKQFEELVAITRTTLTKYERHLKDAQTKSRDLHHSMTQLRDTAQ
jgi:hypothetical protein